MLEELHVRDLALIEDAWLEFSPGMTVLTGETGAGKTALLGALKLLLGERSDSGSVRSGAAETLVEGRFSIGGTEIVAQRRVSAEGRSKAKVDGAMATVGELAERLGPLVDLHGQHDHQALLSPGTHVGYLDRWAGADVTETLAAYRQALEAYHSARSGRDALASRLADAHERADYLRFVAEEIGRVDPTDGEDEELEASLPPLRHAERLREGSQAALEALRAEGGAADRAAEALEELERLAGVDPALDELRDSVRGAQAALDDVGLALRAYRDGVVHDPVALDAAESRLSALAGLKKKYGPSLDAVITARREAQQALDEAGEGDGALREAEQAVATAAAELRATAGALTGAREKATPGFAEAVGLAAHDLAMDGARFEVRITELEFDSWSAEGPHRIEILYAAAPGVAARPLARIASGGELSRVMLALKGVLGAADDVPLLVFDEVDAGVGGATATAVGRRLAELARTHQVIVVTHLAQVAAFADHQLVVRKDASEGSVATSVTTVEGDRRHAEIARMLSGSGSEAGLEHARELLDEAAEARAPAR